MKKLFLIIIALLSINLGYSGIYGGLGGFSGAVIYNDISELNKRLSANGYGQLPDYGFGVSGMGAGIINNVLIGGWGMGIPPLTVDNGKYLLSTMSGFGFFNAGYVVVDSDFIMIIPLLGIGGYGRELEIQPSAISNAGFDYILQNPGTMTRMSYSSIAFEASLLSFVKLGFINVGLKMGYIYVPKSSWSITGLSANVTKLLDQPPVNEHSFYVSVGFYFGGFSKSFKESLKELRDARHGMRYDFFDDDDQTNQNIKKDITNQ